MVSERNGAAGRSSLQKSALMRGSWGHLLIQPQEQYDSALAIPGLYSKTRIITGAVTQCNDGG